MSAQPKPSLPRIVELVRVSGQGQASRDTPADQRAALDKLRKVFPGDLVERIEDGASGLSGAKGIAERPDLQRLGQLSAAKAYDELRVRHTDRLTRSDSIKERAIVFEMVQEAGAIIRTADGRELDPSTDAGELTWSVEGWANAVERRRIHERTLAARRRLSADGVPMTHPGYGRRFDKKTRIWSLVEEEAAVYRRIFADVLDGKSLPQIAAALEQEGVPAPRGGAKWHPTSMAEMIRAENAIGVHTSYGCKIPCPPITDAETQRRASDALRTNAMWSGAPARHEALLRKLARCPDCGSVMHVTPGGSRKPPILYYACASRRRDGGADGACRRYHPVAQIDAAVIRELRVQLKDPERLARGITKRGKAEPEAQDDVEAIRAQLKDLAGQEERLTRMASKGKMSETVYDRMASEIARVRQGAESRLSVAVGRVEAQARRQVKARDLEATLKDAARLVAGGRFAGWRHVVELLFDAGSVLIHEDGTVTLDGGVPVAQPDGDTGSP